MMLELIDKDLGPAGSSWSGTFNVDTSSPVAFFNVDRKSEEKLKKRASRLNKEKIIKFFESIDDIFFGETPEDVKRNKATFKAFFIQTDEPIEKYANSWGFKVTSLLLEWESGDCVICLVFKRDAEMEQKYRGSISGRKYNI